MSEIDRATDRLIADRSMALAIPREPTRTYPQADSLRRDGQANTTPESSSPAADQLQFRAADESRDVAARLEQFASAPADAASVRTLSFAEALRVAQQTGREYLNAEETYIIAALNLLIERHLWDPRLFNDTSVQLSGNGDDGSFAHALDIVNTLRVTQRLPYGGEVEAQWIARATDQLRDQVSGSYQTSSSLVLSGNLPLLRGAGLRAREDLIQAERDLVYAARTFEDFRREYLVDIAGDYFALIESEARIANQQRQLEGLQLLEAQTEANVQAGRLRPFQRDLAANQVLQARASLANLREAYILQLDQFKVRLGLDPMTPVALKPLDFVLPEPETTPTEAASLALEYRLDLQNQRDAIDDARRAVANSKNDILPDLDLNGSVTVPTEPGDDTAGANLRGEELDYLLGATLSLPLDRENERLRLRQSILLLQQAERSFDQFRDTVAVTARASVRSVELARFQLNLAERQIEVNRLGLENLLLLDNADPQSIVDRRNDLLDAENARDAALTDLRNTVLQYLLETGQLRVTGDGQVQELPGLQIRQMNAPGST